MLSSYFKWGGGASPGSLFSEEQGLHQIDSSELCARIVTMRHIAGSVDARLDAEGASVRVLQVQLRTRRWR